MTILCVSGGSKLTRNLEACVMEIESTSSLLRALGSGRGSNTHTNRMIDGWNRLSQQVVSAQTIGSFKRRLDDFMDGDERWV